jgi:hypothetical protein
MCAHVQLPIRPLLMAQSAMRIASAGMMGDPMLPLVFEKNSHVLLCMVFSGPRWNWRMPSL